MYVLEGSSYTRRSISVLYPTAQHIDASSLGIGQWAGNLMCLLCTYAAYHALGLTWSLVAHHRIQSPVCMFGRYIVTLSCLDLCKATNSTHAGGQVYFSSSSRGDLEIVDECRTDSGSRPPIRVFCSPTRLATPLLLGRYLDLCSYFPSFWTCIAWPRSGCKR